MNIIELQAQPDLPDGELIREIIACLRTNMMHETMITQDDKQFWDFIAAWSMGKSAEGIKPKQTPNRPTDSARDMIQTDRLLTQENQRLRKALKEIVGQEPSVEDGYCFHPMHDADGNHVSDFGIDHISAMQEMVQIAQEALSPTETKEQQI
jgi:hypothetical protein